MTLRILEKTDQLLEDGDPGDLTSQGAVWYARWVELLRSNYYRLFDVAQQITDREASLRRPDARAQMGHLERARVEFEQHADDAGIDRNALAVGPLLGPEGRRRGPGIAGAAPVG